MLNLIIFPVIFFFLNTSSLPERNMYPDKKNNHTSEIYLVKQYWHSAIVIKREDMNEELCNNLNLTGDANLIDFGWGDEEFYQFPGFDSGLAFKALFYKTPSTLRVEAIRITEASYFDISEIVIRIGVTETQLEKILGFINNTLYRNREGKIEIISERGLGMVKFFKAIGEYHLFNTCNTWIANCLINAGIEIEENIILTEQLFNEAINIGDLIKVRK